jgi:hypothetical protein
MIGFALAAQGYATVAAQSPRRRRARPEAMENPEVLISSAVESAAARGQPCSRGSEFRCSSSKSPQFISNHVRGEWIAPWGVAETQRRLYDNLIEAGGHHLGEHITFGDDVDEATARAEALNFSAFEGAGIKPPLCLRHPAMCNLLNATALKSGATMQREVGDVRVVSGNPPQVHFRHEGRDLRTQAVVRDCEPHVTPTRAGCRGEAHESCLDPSHGSAHTALVGIDIGIESGLIRPNGGHPSRLQPLSARPTQSVRDEACRGLV